MSSGGSNNRPGRKATQWKPGQSGNPRGRPRKDKERIELFPGLPPAVQQAAQKMLLLEAYRELPTADGGRTVPQIQIVFRAWVKSAMMGNVRAQCELAHFVRQAELDEVRKHEARLERALTYKLDMAEEKASRRLNGDLTWEPIPHPDDVVIDLSLGTVTIEGPYSEEGKKQVARMIALRDSCQAKAEEFAALHTDAKSQTEREMLLLKIITRQQLFDELNNRLPVRLRAELKSRILPSESELLDEAFATLEERIACPEILDPPPDG